MAKVSRALNVVSGIAVGRLNVRSLLLLAMCCFFWNPLEAAAQLWETPPLPAVKYAPAPDGMTFSVGAEQVHISVCRSAVIHFVANPEPSNAIRQTSHGCLIRRSRVPGQNSRYRRPRTR